MAISSSNRRELEFSGSCVALTPRMRCEVSLSRNSLTAILLEMQVARGWRTRLPIVFRESYTRHSIQDNIRA